MFFLFKRAKGMTRVCWQNRQQHSCFVMFVTKNPLPTVNWRMKTLEVRMLLNITVEFMLQFIRTSKLLILKRKKNAIAWSFFAYLLCCAICLYITRASCFVGRILSRPLSFNRSVAWSPGIKSSKCLWHTRRLHFLSIKAPTLLKIRKEKWASWGTFSL